MVKFCPIEEYNLIGSARGITQMEISGKRIVTIIGELHDKEFECMNNITIYDYCLKRANENKKCRFLFEFEPNRTNNFNRIGSKIIRDVFAGEDNIVKKRSTGVDIRLDILSMLQQQYLYNNSQGFSMKYDITRADGMEALKKDYVKSYRNDVQKDPEQTMCSENLSNYGKSLDKLFYGLKKQGELTRDDLKWAWSKLMDYNVIWEMTRKDNDVDEIIVVLGENHRSNIYEIMKEWNGDCVILSNQYGGKRGNCVEVSNLKTVCKN